MAVFDCSTGLSVLYQQESMLIFHNIEVVITLKITVWIFTAMGTSNLIALSYVFGKDYHLLHCGVYSLVDRYVFRMSMWPPSSGLILTWCYIPKGTKMQSMPYEPQISQLILVTSFICEIVCMNMVGVFCIIVHNLYSYNILVVFYSKTKYLILMNFANNTINICNQQKVAVSIVWAMTHVI